jgi:hypothetical protein
MEHVLDVTHNLDTNKDYIATLKNWVLTSWNSKDWMGEKKIRYTNVANYRPYVFFELRDYYAPHKILLTRARGGMHEEWTFTMVNEPPADSPFNKLWAVAERHAQYPAEMELEDAL